MSQIDWSKQPEGFPLWLEGLGTHRCHSGWYRRSGEVFEHENEGQFRSVREGQFFTIHERPAHSVWSGEGLPPVGTVCEHEGRIDDREWTEVKVIAHTEKRGYEVAVFEYEDIVTYSTARYFRPIRTPEQIAAEERDSKARVMYESIYFASHSKWENIPEGLRETFRLAIDSGWQQVKP